MEMLLIVIIGFCWLALPAAADLCNWTGSGFASADSRVVLQVRLSCAEGSVRWVDPAQALRVVLDPKVSSSGRSRICIKPFASLGRVSMLVERAGKMQLLEAKRERAERQVVCFSADGAERPAIYLQASPRGDEPGGRGVIGFRYELLGNRSAAPHGGMQASCRPCSEAELLMAVCNSDFVIRAYIKNVSHDCWSQTSSVEVWASRVYWQRSGVFEHQLDPSGSPSWHGRIHTMLRCHLKLGDGEFLFTGSEHFGEAWLGCAPRYKNFLSVYEKARLERRNSCDFPLG
ncbi:Meteorin-like protein [Oryzias melastigma]|uniref:Meteorin-like protein n=1 Tax=Oryzias melastigma TaxID=30732 RepID=A0A834BXR5_ORYME|nr:Meteorin-like protein [Oryzias melastigma]